MAIYSPPQCDSSTTATHPLWGSALGAQILELESQLLNPMLRRLHGDVVVWAGEHGPSAQSLTQCMVRQQAHVFGGDQPRTEGPLPALVADLQQLPFAANSVDGFVVHHALEQVQDPRVALREIARVLAPGGRALICGFNPLSLMGLRRLYARFFDDALSGQRMVNPIRLFDWLAVLGLELQASPVYCGYVLPRVELPWHRPENEESADESNSEEITPADIARETASQMQAVPARVPFAGLLIIDVVKQVGAHRRPWVPSKREQRLAPVAYPRVASWQRNKH